MSINKDGWLDVIAAKLEQVGIVLIDYDRKSLRSLSVKQLAVVENLIGLAVESACPVGCGDCAACKQAGDRDRKRKSPTTITADTITHEQLRSLAKTGGLTAKAWALAAMRVTYRNTDERKRREARARCAEILNARGGK